MHAMVCEEAKIIKIQLPIIKVFKKGLTVKGYTHKDWQS